MSVGSESMIERVARAMQADAGQPADEAYWDTPCTGAVVWRSLARAVLQAIMEPTLEQKKAGVKFAMSVSLGADYQWTEYMRDLWQAMIRAALEEGEDG